VGRDNYDDDDDNNNNNNNNNEYSFLYICKYLHIHPTLWFPLCRLWEIYEGAFGPYPLYHVDCQKGCVSLRENSSLQAGSTGTIGES
jgi:hypothetical protein